MKKTYQTPTSELSTVEMELLTVTSLFEQTDDGGMQQNLDNPDNTTNATSGNLSRRSVWDDEELGEEY